MTQEFELKLRSPRADDADPLYEMLVGTSITDHLLWNGPEDVESFRQGLVQRREQVVSGEIYFVVIEVDGRVAGTMDIRPQGHRADIGLWIAESEQGRGVGTAAIREIVKYGDDLGLVRQEAYIFVGNWPSRRIFEKNGFALEGTLRKYAAKNGEYRDEWILARIVEE